MWFDRMGRLLFESASHLAVAADDKWGLGYVLATHEAGESRVLLVELEESDADSAVRQGNRLSDGVYAGIGTRLFGLGVPFAYGLSLLRKNLDHLAPMVIVLKNPQYGEEMALQLAAMSSPAFRLLEVYPETDTPRALPMGKLINPAELAMQLSEAVHMFGTHLPEAEIEDLWRKSEGAYAVLLASVNRRLALPPPARPWLRLQYVHNEVNSASPEVLDLLVREGQWVDAFSLAVKTGQYGIASDMVSHAGEAFFEAGLFSSFWNLIRSFPETYLADDAAAYWLLSAAIATNSQDEVREFLQSKLALEPLPNLRALMACSNMSGKSLEEAERAFSDATTVMTVRAMAHCLSAFGRPNEALRVALDNLPQVESLATPRELANCSYTVSRILLFLGRYSAAREWVNWGLKIYSDAELKEELLRLALVSAKAYYALLRGEPEETESALETISLDPQLAGIPSMDAVFSTAADLKLVNGDYSAALELYSLNHREAPRELVGYTIVDVVGALIMCGRKAEALAAASECHSIAQGTHERNAALARLGLAIATASAGAARAREQLTAAVTYFLNTGDSVAVCRASLHLAQLHLRQGRKNRAVQALLDVREHLNDLGESGWLLLGLPTEECKYLREEVAEGHAPLYLKLMGARRASYLDTEHVLSLRNAEVLALLAAEPGGMTGERLALDLYGDRGTLSALKPIVSRLRQLIPITSRPYSIGARFEADHVVIQRLISEGRVSEALDIYNGPLLPLSEAPGIERIREVIDESLRQAVLASGDRNLLLGYCEKVADDLDAIEHLAEQLAPSDPRHATVNAHLARIRKDWGMA